MQKYSKTVGAIGWAAGFVRTSKHGTAPIVDYYPYRYMPANGLYRTNIHYLGSGGMFAKVAVLKKAGLFDEIYDPTCYEDTDLSFAIRNLKYNIAYSPYLGVYHIPHQTTKNGEIDHNSMLDEHEQIFLNKWKNINPDLLKK
jgi:GT2 family glycosyltransferase